MSQEPEVNHILGIGVGAEVFGFFAGSKVYDRMTEHSSFVGHLGAELLGSFTVAAVVTAYTIVTQKMLIRQELARDETFKKLARELVNSNG